MRLSSIIMKGEHWVYATQEAAFPPCSAQLPGCSCSGRITWPGPGSGQHARIWPELKPHRKDSLISSATSAADIYCASIKHLLDILLSIH